MSEITQLLADALVDIEYGKKNELYRATVAWVESTAGVEGSLSVTEATGAIADCYADIRKSSLTPETMQLISKRMTELVLDELQKKSEIT